MTYSQDQVITVSDFNSMVNDTNGVVATGTGSSGYGEVPIATVSQGEIITSAKITELRNTINTAANHQGTTVNIPPVANLEASDTAIAHIPATDTYDIPTAITAITTNVNNVAGDSLALVSNAHTVTARSSNWSGEINAEAKAIFPSEDATRHFFNSGGEIRIDFHHPNSASSPGQDNAWRSGISNMGTIIFGFNGTTRTGSAGTPNTGFGYYNLTSGFNQIFNGTNILSGAYSTNDIYVDARYTSGTYVGGNGAKGREIEFRFRLVDQHSSYEDVVASGTNVKLSYKYAATYLSNISTPTFSNLANVF